MKFEESEESLNEEKVVMLMRLLIDKELAKVLEDEDGNCIKERANTFPTIDIVSCFSSRSSLNLFFMLIKMKGKFSVSLVHV